MTEYIEREATIEQIEKREYFMLGNKTIHVEAMKTFIRNRPAADVAPVRHGRWRCHGDCGVTECSACGWSIEEYVGDYAYCPNCGARMDGGTN